MKIISEIDDLSDFDAWSGATDTKDKIVVAGKGEEFMSALEDIYPDGISDGYLNNLLWFEENWCLDLVGLLIKAEHVIELDEFQEKIDELIEEFIEENNEYSKEDFYVDPAYFGDEIEVYLENNSGFANENEAFDSWFDDEGEDLIKEAIEECVA